MKKLFLLSVLFCFATSIELFGQVNPNNTYINGYQKSNGTNVNGHYRTNPNNTKNDNYSTYPNVNPYTGKKGSVKQDSGYPSQNRSRKKNSYSY